MPEQCGVSVCDAMPERSLRRGDARGAASATRAGPTCGAGCAARSSASATSRSAAAARRRVAALARAAARWRRAAGDPEPRLRAHASRDDGVVVVSDRDGIRADLDRAGDEPLMLARQLRRRRRSWSSSDRYLAGRLAEHHFGVHGARAGRRVSAPAAAIATSTSGHRRRDDLEAARGRCRPAGCASRSTRWSRPTRSLAADDGVRLPDGLDCRGCPICARAAAASRSRPADAGGDAGRAVGGPVAGGRRHRAIPQRFFEDLRAGGLDDRRRRCRSAITIRYSRARRRRGSSAAARAAGARRS